MPLFGARMVCETANYKHIEETKKKFAQREENLGDWEKEKSERKAALQELRLQTKQASESRSRSASRKNSLLVSPSGNQTIGDVNKSALEMAATMTATMATTVNNPDSIVPDINVQDHSD